MPRGRPRKTDTDTPTAIDPNAVYGLFEAARLVGRSHLRLADNVRRGHITPDAYRKPDVKQFPLFKGATLLAFLANPPARGRPTTLTETQKRALELADEAARLNINPARHIAETLGIRVDSAHQLLDRARRRAGE
jgi:hypothetical protein